MSEPSKEDFSKAVAILDRYRRALAARLAEEILEHEEDFDNPYIGQAEQIFDRYSGLLYELSWVYDAVEAFADSADGENRCPDGCVPATPGAAEERCKIVALDNAALLTAMMEALAGQAHVSFEGDLSGCRLSAIPGASVEEADPLRRCMQWPRRDFIVLPLEAGTIRPILAEVLPEGGVPHDIAHVQIEKDGQLAFGAYDHFHPKCIFAWPAVPAALLQDLQARGVLRSFEQDRPEGGA